MNLQNEMHKKGFFISIRTGEKFFFYQYNLMLCMKKHICRHFLWNCLMIQENRSDKENPINIPKYPPMFPIKLCWL